uniref:Truncated precore/core protein n=1 Tax=Hepatitis B virus TaxID=10407 RepID=A0A060CJJ2_HBV|nr:truncated precore/core protein [Hepatitis B virus]
MQLFHLCLIISCSRPVLLFKPPSCALGGFRTWTLTRIKNLELLWSYSLFCLPTSSLIFEISSTPPLLCIERP